jgi:hypothetical protein
MESKINSYVEMTALLDDELDVVAGGECTVAVQEVKCPIGSLWIVRTAGCPGGEPLGVHWFP